MDPLHSVRLAADHLATVLAAAGMRVREVDVSQNAISYLCKESVPDLFKKKVLPTLLAKESGWSSHYGTRFLLAQKGGKEVMVEAWYIRIRSDRIVSSAELLGGLIASILRGHGPTPQSPPAVGAVVDFAFMGDQPEEELAPAVALPSTRPRKIGIREWDSSRASVVGMATDGEAG